MINRLFYFLFTFCIFSMSSLANEIKVSKKKFKIIKQTGQSKSYATNGNEITDSSLKDDGYYKKGLPVKYTKGSNILIDNTTGLIWEDTKNVSSLKKPWNEADSYCKDLILNSNNDWRLPTPEELENVIDYTGHLSKSNKTYFKNHGYYYVSSTKKIINKNKKAYAFHAYYAITYGETTMLEINYPMSVRCVRGTEKKDKINIELEWENSSKKPRKNMKKWEESIEYCETLSENGYTDWRLPNINELRSLLDRNNTKPAIVDGFKNTGLKWVYWSSTTGNITGCPIGVDFTFGTIVSTIGKDSKAFVRCVRDK